MESLQYHSFYAAPSTAMDTFSVDVSGRLAREQIARQMAASSSLRRQQYYQQQSRVSKPASTGTSPQNLARRRQAAGPRLHSVQPDAVHAAAAVRRRAATSTAARPLSMFAGDSRSSSWHSRPAAMPAQDHYASRHSMYESKQNMCQYQTVAMNGLPTPITHAETQNTLPLDASFSLDSSPSFQPQYLHMPVSDDWSIESSAGQILTPASTYQPTPSAYPLDYVQTSFGMYQQLLNASISTLAVQSAIHTAPPTPDMLSVPGREDMCKSVYEESIVEDDIEEDGPELIGMGLYDDPTPPQITTGGELAPSNGGSPTGSAKMLKLCDAWTPPEGEDDDEDDDEEDDGEEEDGDEEI